MRLATYFISQERKTNMAYVENNQCIERLYLRDGTTVATMRDMVSAVETTLGADAADYVAQMFNTLNELKPGQKRQDLYAQRSDDYEAISDGYYNQLQEIERYVDEKLRELKDAKRLNREKIYNQFKEILNLTSNY